MVLEVKFNTGGIKQPEQCIYDPDAVNCAEAQYAYDYDSCKHYNRSQHSAQ